MNKPIVSIIGRINVGKSTLFNRIAGKRKAIVKDEPGITRDRIYAECVWQNKPFILVDSGGVDIKERKGINHKIISQTALAIKEADVIILLVDIKEGINTDDFKVAKMIRDNSKPCILVANKGDIQDSEKNLFDFYELGFGEALIISAEHGIKIDYLMNKIISFFPEDTYVPENEEEVLKISILGKPNVGKSSLLNNILGEERLIVSDYPGTTRDAIEIKYKKEKQKLLFIDTAGLRQKAKIKEDIEYYSSLRAMQAVQNSDIVLLVIDSTSGISMQYKKITDFVYTANKAGIIILNKFDLIKDNVDKKWLVDEIRYELPFAKNFPIIFISALTGYNVSEIFKVIEKISKEYCKQISTPELNNFIREIVNKNPPKYINKHCLKINYATQIGIKPPRFLLFVNNPKLMYNSYQKYLTNCIYNKYGFEGTPIVIELTRKDKKIERKKRKNK